MSNMSRGRKDYGPRSPVVKKKVATKPRTVLDNARAAAKAGGGGIPTTKEVPLGGMTKEIGRRASKDAAKTVASRKAKAASRKQKMQVAAKAGSDMAEGLAADRQRFSQEHDQAVQEGAAMHAKMRRSTPGKAQDIIKRRRV